MRASSKKELFHNLLCFGKQGLGPAFLLPGFWGVKAGLFQWLTKATRRCDPR